MRPRGAAARSIGGGTSDAYRFAMPRPVVRRFTPWVAASLGACVWTSGNPEPVTPHDERITVVASRPPTAIAWAARIAPTPQQAAQLEALRDAARSHRMASPAVRAAEGTACAGLGDDDRDVTPFFYRDDVVDVQPLRGPDGALPGRLEGAAVTFRRVEGLSQERMQRLVDCQIARDAALEYRVPEVGWCPLAVAGTLARVADSESGLDVRLVAASADAATETYVRAVALAPLH